MSHVTSSVERDGRAKGSMLNKARIAALVELSFWLGFVAIGFWYIAGMPDLSMFAGFDPRWWPQAVLFLILFIALGQFSVRLRNMGTATAQQATADTQAERPLSIRQLWSGIDLKTTATFVVPLIYVALMPRMGFVLSTPLFVALYLYVLGERRPRLIVGLALGVTALFILVFLRIFYIDLPIGSWPGFYEFGDWFLRVLL